MDSIPENSMYASSNSTKIGRSRIFKRASFKLKSAFLGTPE
jgi:hypothetical protein